AIEQAAAAYDVITGKLSSDDGRDERSSKADADSAASGDRHIPGYRCGVVLAYGDTAGASGSKVANPRARKPGVGQIGIGFIGAGNFARGILLPIVARSRNVKLTGVASATGVSGKNTAEQFGFGYSTSDYTEILDDPATTCVFVATRHDTHAAIAGECLKRGKSVYVEKPLAITEEGLREVLECAAASSGHLFVGYNRRFAPVAAEVKERLIGRSGSMSIIYRVNAGRLPANHWSHDPEQGGRVMGEVCHFIDFVQFLTDSTPVRVSAEGVAVTAGSNVVDD